MTGTGKRPVLPEHYRPVNVEGDICATLETLDGHVASGCNKNDMSDGHAKGVHFPTFDDRALWFGNYSALLPGPQGQCLLGDLVIGVETFVHWQEREEDKKREAEDPVRKLRGEIGHPPANPNAPRSVSLDTVEIEVESAPIV